MITKTSFAQKAIKSALEGQWQEAASLNKQILESNPENIPAQLRLAKAYTNLNQISKAKKQYRKIISLDKYNPIAKRNLSRLQKIKDGTLSRNSSPLVTVFLEEPGKTKSVCLVRITDEENLAALELAEPIELIYNPRSITACKNGKYIGRLPDDLAYRLLHLVKRGNTYEAFIRSIDKNRLQIFIKEVKKSRRNEQIPSFPPRSNKEEYQTFIPTEILGEKEPLITGFDEEC